VTKKQIIFPIVFLIIGVGAYSLLAGMKKPPEEKKVVDTTPIVAVQEVEVAPLNLSVESYGIVQPKYETELVAQVSGQIVSLSDDFVRGGLIKKGQLLATIDPSDYEASLIDADANLASAIASLELEKAQGKVAEREWQRIKDTSPTELSLRKPQLAQEMARVKAAEAAVKRATRNLERTKIIAPYDAMISDRKIGLGSFVGVGSYIGKLLNIAVAKVRLPVADNQLQFLLNQGVQAKVTLTSKFSGGEIQWQATIARSEGVIDKDSRMNYLVAEIQDPYGLKSDKQAIRYGTYVNATISGINVASAVLVPRYLVNNSQVAVMDKDKKLRFKNIEILRQQGSQVVVASGLKSGDLIITSALDFPLAGMQLSLIGDDSEEESEPLGETQIALEGETK